MRGGGLFLGPGGEALQKIEGDVRAKAGGLCRRESVKGGGRDALNGVWERRRKQRQRPLFSAAFPQARRYIWFNGHQWRTRKRKWSGHQCLEFSLHST